MVSFPGSDEISAFCDYRTVFSRLCTLNPMISATNVVTVAVIGKENEPEFNLMREENVMSASTTVVGALSLVLVSASGMAGAVAHPKVSYVWVSESVVIEHSAAKIQLGEPVETKNASAPACRRQRCRRNMNTPSK
jgi:hypothetical protein